VVHERVGENVVIAALSCMLQDFCSISPRLLLVRQGSPGPAMIPNGSGAWAYVNNSQGVTVNVYPPRSSSRSRSRPPTELPPPGLPPFSRVPRFPSPATTLCDLEKQLFGDDEVTRSELVWLLAREQAITSGLKSMLAGLWLYFPQWIRRLFKEFIFAAAAARAPAAHDADDDDDDDDDADALTDL